MNGTVTGVTVRKTPSNLEDIQAIQEAKRAIEESRRNALKTLFKGRKLVPKTSKFVDDAKQAKKAAEKAKAKLKKLGLDDEMGIQQEEIHRPASERGPEFHE